MQEIVATEQECRECAPELRQMCIERANLSPAIKEMLIEAFKLGRVIQGGEYYLLPHCLKRRKFHAGLRQGVGLAARIQQQEPEVIIPAPSPPEVTADKHKLLSSLKEVVRPGIHSTVYALVAHRTYHRIALLPDTKLILGTMDTYYHQLPDIDLTCDEKPGEHTVDRLHARLIVYKGHYFVEDLDNMTGTWVNQCRLPPKGHQEFKLGDQLRFGNCVFSMEEEPECWSLPMPQRVYYLYSTFTGHTFSLPCWSTITIGRADPQRNSIPDIDLSQEGEIALLVSRQHAAIRCTAGKLAITDLGSSNQTKVDGTLIPEDTWVPLQPGQHLWLGGLVLALDVKD
ncbi:MAG: FHA domain-containing protein [Anaerolineae bacterium]|nr:FHA domain-containing protein [Anaerolineae bacterium]